MREHLYNKFLAKRYKVFLATKSDASWKFWRKRKQTYESKSKNYLNNLEIATSETTPYNSAGNGKVEGYNRVLWKTIDLTQANNYPVSTCHLAPVENWYQEAEIDLLQEIPKMKNKMS